MASRWRDLVDLEQVIILGAPTMAYIAPLKLHLGQQQAPKNRKRASMSSLHKRCFQQRNDVENVAIAGSKLNLGFRLETNTKHPSEGEMPTNLVDASKEGNDTHRCRHHRHRPKTGRTFVRNIAHLQPRPMDWGNTVQIGSHRRRRSTLSL